MLELNSFPLELLLAILQYLPLQSLRAMMLISREWRNLFTTNEQLIFRNAAILHRFVSHHTVSLADAKAAYSPALLNNVDDWYTFCNRLFTMHKNWCGDTSAIKIRAFDAPGTNTNIHRLKVDEGYNFLITTHARPGGLTVRDLVTESVLWELPGAYVRTFAHCEYQQGFLIFDRGESKEVWRHVPDYDEEAAQLVSQRPDNAQRQAGARFMNSNTAREQRGCFKPWALLTMPEFGRAYRFVYPTLLVVSLVKAYLYNVVEGKLIQVIDLAADDDDLIVHINYVEVNDKYVFVCCTGYLRIYARSNGENVLRIAARPLLSFRHFKTQESRTYPDNRPRPKHIAALLELHSAPDFTPFDPDDIAFIAVHFSGPNLVALLSDDRILLLRDYEDVITNKQPLESAAIIIAMRPEGYSTSVYLAYERGHVGAVTASGVSVFTVDAMEHELIHPTGDRIPSIRLNPDLHDTPFPNLIGCRILPFSDHRDLDEVSCLQMSDNKLYLTYTPRVIDTHRSMLQRFRDYANRLGHEGNNAADPNIDWTSDIVFATRAFEKCVVSVDFS